MSINNNIDTVLSALGWHDGFRIPVANEENIRLEEEVMYLRYIRFISVQHISTFSICLCMHAFVSHMMVIGNKLLHSSKRK